MRWVAAEMQGDSALSPVLPAEALLGSYRLKSGPDCFLAAMQGAGLGSCHSAVGWLLTPWPCFHLKDLGTSSLKQRTKHIFTRANPISPFQSKLVQSAPNTF